jgi:two-component system, OmpR family, KDP operon response regulator KdpE
MNMETPKPSVLCIEDESPICLFLKTILSANGYTYLQASTGADGLVQAATRNPDIILLDLGLPDMDGLEVTHRLREWSKKPIIVVSARGREADKVAALDKGADDYLTKPFGTEELLARIRVALRHSEDSTGKPDEPLFRHGELEIDLAHRRVFRSGTEVHLTPREFRLLAILVRHAGKVVTQKQLLTEIWGEAYADQSHYLRVHMNNLRQKLEKEPGQPQHFRTEPGVGYRLETD